MKIIYEDDPEGRRIWCQGIVLSRNTIRSIYYHTFFFGFLFRFCLIRYADRGLVRDGSPQLDLFNKLYWVVYTAFVTIAIVHPITTIIQGTFFKFQKLKLCLGLPTADLNGPDRPQSSISSAIWAVMTNFLMLSVCFWFKYRVKRYLKGLCPKKQMSCIGRYTRNLINFDQCFYMMCIWSCKATLGVVIIDHMNLSSVSIFWYDNVVTFLFLDILNGLLFPLFITVFVTFEQPREIRLTKFYVRRSVVLEPRRYFYGEPSSQAQADIASTSKKTKHNQQNIYQIVPCIKRPHAPSRQQIPLDFSPPTPLKKTSRHLIVTVHRDAESGSDWQIEI